MFRKFLKIGNDLRSFSMFVNRKSSIEKLIQSKREQLTSGVNKGVITA